MENLFDCLKNRKFVEGKDGNSEPNKGNENLMGKFHQLTENLELWNSVPCERAASSVPEKPEEGENAVEGRTKLSDPPDIKEILGADKDCIFPSAHNVGIINVACQQVLNEIEKQLLFLLKKNKREQEIVEHYLSANGKPTTYDVIKKPCMKCLGMPYFKDPEGYPPPINKDVVKKKLGDKLLAADFIEGPPVWGTIEVKTLIKAVNKFIGSAPKSDLHIDWMKIAATDMNGKYSPTECKSKWMMNLRPDITKSRWGRKEKRALEEVAEIHNFQDWDKIARDLGSGRSGFQCCVEYQTGRAPNRGKWTKEEDEKLKRIIDKYRVKEYIPWQKITWNFEQRTLRQCQERYIYHLSEIKKGGFTEEEDFVLVYLAKKLNNFGEVAKYFPKRVSTQLRARYEYLVKTWMPDFTKEEDELLMNLMASYPRNWDKISEAFDNRSKLQCRGRWASIQKEIKVEESSDDEREESFESADVEKCIKKSKESVNEVIVKKNIEHLTKAQGNSRAHRRKHSKEYERLLEYHKHCYKFLFGPKARVPCDPEQCRKLAAKLETTMSKLAVGSPIPSHEFNLERLSDNCEFDGEDEAVLNCIKCNEGKEKLSIGGKAIPPNYVTLVGARTLFLAWSNLRNSCDFYDAEERIRDDNDVLSKKRMLFGDAKKLFKSRMKALFTFPFLLSNISSKQIETDRVYKPKIRRSVKPMSKRKRKKHAKFMREMYTQKLEKKVQEKLIFSDFYGASDDLGYKEKTRESQNREFSQKIRSQFSNHSTQNSDITKRKRSSKMEDSLNEIIEKKKSKLI